MKKNDKTKSTTLSVTLTDVEVEILDREIQRRVASGDIAARKSQIVREAIEKAFGR